MYSLVLLCDSYRPPHQRRSQRSELNRMVNCAAAGDNATPTPNLRDGKCLNFQRETDRQLKLSKLSPLKGLKLSKMSKPLEVASARGYWREGRGRSVSKRTCGSYEREPSSAPAVHTRSTFSSSVVARSPMCVSTGTPVTYPRMGQRSKPACPSPKEKP